MFIKAKFELLKANPKVWNPDVFGILDTNKKKILKDIEDLDNRDDCSELSGSEKLKRMELINQLRVVNKKQESLFRQKAKGKRQKLNGSGLGIQIQSTTIL